MSYFNNLRKVIANQGGYLFDEYPGAFGVAPRYLSSDFVGDPVFLVERHSDNTTDGFTPTELTDGTVESFCGASNGGIRTAYDQSGNGYDVSEADPLKQPLIVDSGTLITLNGKPCLDTDGANLKTNVNDTSIGAFFALSVFQKYGSNNSFESNPFTFTNVNTAKPFDRYNSRFIRNISIRTDIAQNIRDITSQSIFTQKYGDNSEYIERLNGSEVVNISDTRTINTDDQVLTLFSRDDGVTQLRGYWQETIIFPVSTYSNVSDIEQTVNNHYGAF